MKCPVCGYNGEIEKILKLGRFDKSVIYESVKIACCLRCGHYYNDLSYFEIDNLKKYYSTEYPEINKNISGDRDLLGKPGQSRYKQLHDILKPETDSTIVDVGCGEGGFIQYLNERGHKNASGVEVCESKFLKGSAGELPFESDSVDLIVLDQVMEHLIEPKRAFQEANRVLKNNGTFCVGVPDAEKYCDYSIFPLYWFLIREHIQHFTSDKLRFLGYETGFNSSIKHSATHEVIPNYLTLPVMYIKFQKARRPALEQSFCENNISSYLSKKPSTIKTPRKAYIWGIGAEFWYLYKNGLEHLDIEAFVDSNPYKLNQKIEGNKISEPDVLRTAPIDSVLIITSAAHKNIIGKQARELGFKGEIITI